MRFFAEILRRLFGARAKEVPTNDVKWNDGLHCVRCGRLFTKQNPAHGGKMCMDCWAGSPC